MICLTWVHHDWMHCGEVEMFCSFLLGIWMHCILYDWIHRACILYDWIHRANSQQPVLRPPMIVYKILNDSYFRPISCFCLHSSNPRAEAPATLLIDTRVCKHQPNKALSRFMVLCILMESFCNSIGKLSILQSTKNSSTDDTPKGKQILVSWKENLRICIW
jgi:hypothetical protein